MSKYSKNQAKSLDEILAPLNKERKEWEIQGKLSWGEKHLQIDTADFLGYLSKTALSVGFCPFYDMGEREKTFSHLMGDDYKSDNTYNYNEPFSRPLQVSKPNERAKGFDPNRAYTIAFAPHYGGDIRGNYGDFIILTFGNYYDYCDIYNDYTGTYASADIETEGGDLLNIDWAGGDSYEVFYNGDYKGSICPDFWNLKSEADLLKQIRQDLGIETDESDESAPEKEKAPAPANL